MKIDLELSENGINSAARKILDALDEFRQDVRDIVDIVVTEGADIANTNYGSMATAVHSIDNEDLEHGIVEGHIGVTADSPETAIIAEFGAGDAVIDYSFENKEPVPIYPGSYSELVGTGEYAAKGYWRFGGKRYTQVEPRRGLANAKAFIVTNAEDIVREVIQQ